ncbi:MAG: RraA family protein [Proteobacteria bacterium]|nr:RraA family protein [Pseudomonadota bacterium]
MNIYQQFSQLSPTAIADALSREQVMDIGIRPLWNPMPRIAGPAFTVKCAPGDNLMLHAAIYRAPRGSVIVVQSDDINYALAGGNVCKVAQKNGIQAFVLDGVIRDVAEAREIGFPVFARGIMPIPGAKNVIGTLGDAPVRCGGVNVAPGDIVVADEEGIVVVSKDKVDVVLHKAKDRAAKDASETLESWERSHRAKIDEQLAKHGFKG